MRYVLIIPLLLLPSALFAQEWEYLTIEIRDQLFDKSLNLVGNEGWELVSSRRVISKIRGTATECIFKRQKSLLKSGKSVKETKVLLIDLELNYLNQLQAAEAKRNKDIEEAKKLAKKELKDKIQRAISGELLLGESFDFELKDEQALLFIKLKFISMRKDGMWLYIKTEFKNISKVRIKSITATCFVRAENLEVIKMKKKSVLRSSLMPGRKVDYEFVFLFLGEKLPFSATYDYYLNNVKFYTD